MAAEKSLKGDMMAIRLDVRRVAALLALVAPKVPAGGAPFDLADCADCDHRPKGDGGHCYMFREPPTTRCGQKVRLRGDGHAG